MQLDLSFEEQEILSETLTSYLSDLSYEIGNTDSLDYRKALKHRASILKRILSTLQAQDTDRGSAES